MRLALTKQRANENFLIRHTFKRQFFVFHYAAQIKSFYQIQIKINMAENYVDDECFDFELEEDTIVNVVDYMTNNEYKNLEILAEEEFTAEEFQVIEENKYKLSSCLLQEIPMLTITDGNVDESTRKPTNPQLTKPFICQKFGKSYRKQKFYEIHVKHGE